MGRIDNTINKSKKLVDVNNNLKEYSKRLQAYVFSPKIRSILFGYKDMHQTRNLIVLVVERLDYIIKEVDVLVQDAQEYYNQVVSLELLFKQTKYYKRTIRFSYNAIIFSKKY